MKKVKTFYYRYRSAISGRFCSKSHAAENPKTTVRIKVERRTK